MDQFLNRLPKVVVKAGRVIDIRDSLRDILQVRNSCSTPPFFAQLLQYERYLTSVSNRVQLTPRAAAQ